MAKKTYRIIALVEVDYDEEKLAEVIADTLDPRRPDIGLKMIMQSGRIDDSSSLLKWVISRRMHLIDAESEGYSCALGRYFGQVGIEKIGVLFEENNVDDWTEVVNRKS